MYIALAGVALNSGEAEGVILFAVGARKIGALAVFACAVEDDK